jgi:tRNA (guanine-N(7)-)-methyltransferase
MGKGKFIMELASQNPSVNYIGVERYTSVLYRALQKMETETLPNLKFLCVDAKILPEIFAPGEIDKIYLNFSDPWPKDRHAKRRLTSGAFLSCYDSVLKPEGTIEFKTDNKGLFDFSMEEIPGQGWKINASTTDLHRDTSMNQGNVMTEYEEKFSAMGNPIYKLIASR